MAPFEIDRGAGSLGWLGNAVRRRLVVTRVLPMLPGLLTVVIAILHARWLSTELPMHVAIHFNALGQADAWSSRTTFVTVYLGTVFVVATVFGVIDLALLWGREFAWVNLPNRAFWMAPDRRPATVSYLRWCMQAMALFTLMILLTVFYSAGRANIAGQDLDMGVVWPALLGYMLGVGIVVVAILRRFGKVPSG